MNEYLNTKFEKIGEKKLFIFCPLVSLLSDLILIYYAVNILLPQILKPDLIATFFKIQYGPQFRLTLETFQMFKEISSSLVTIMLFGVFLFNCIIGYNVFKRSHGSIIYLKGYAFSAVFLSVFELGTYLIKLHEFNFFTFITMSLYFFTYYGLRHVELKKEQS